MGNPMTPFVPPAAAFNPSVVNILASTAVANNIVLTNTQALSGIFYLSGTSTNSTAGPYIQFPTNAPAKEYVFLVDAITTGTTGNVMGIVHVGGGGIQSIYPSLVYTLAHFPSGSPAGTYFARTSATNIAYNANP